jgi:hypothetical protein
MAKRTLESRIAQLESLIMNESLFTIANNDVIEKLSNLNRSNQLDKDKFRWASRVNLLSNLIDTMLEDEQANADSKEISDMYKSLEKTGYVAAADLINDMIHVLDMKMEDFKWAKNNLNEILKSAKKFDRANLLKAKRDNKANN